MTLVTAKTMLVRDRLDWRTPHLRWIPKGFYRRFFRAAA